MVKIKNILILLYRLNSLICRQGIGTYVRKISEKKPGKKPLVKKSQFSEVLGENVAGKVLSFRFLGRFFPKKIWGLPIQSEEIR